MDGEAVVLGIDGISDLNASTMKRSSSAPSIAMDGDDLRRLSAPAAASSLCVARGWERSEELKRLGSFRKNVTGSHRFCFSGFRRRTPGPPPLSSMRLDAARWLYLNSQIKTVSCSNREQNLGSLCNKSSIR